MLINLQILIQEMVMENKLILHFGYLNSFLKMLKFYVQLVKDHNLYNIFRKNNVKLLIFIHIIHLLNIYYKMLSIKQQFYQNKNNNNLKQY